MDVEIGIQNDSSIGNNGVSSKLYDCLTWNDAKPFIYFFNSSISVKKTQMISIQLLDFIKAQIVLSSEYKGLSTM